MKRLLSCLAILLGCWTATTSASDLTIRFTGKFVTSTCAFAIPDMNLGTYQAGLFTGSYTTTWITGQVTASNCTPDITTVHMAFTGTADSTNSSFFKAMPVAGQGAIAGVGIDLSTNSGTPSRIAPNSTVNWSLSSGSTFPFKARFYQTLMPVTPGQMKTPITVQFTYN